MDARQTVIEFLKAHQARDERAIAQLCAPDVKVRGGPVELVGVQAYIDDERRAWSSLKSQTIVAENVVSSDDNVVVQWMEQSEVASGPSQQHTVAGCTVYKVANGRISDVAIYVDNSTLS